MVETTNGAEAVDTPSPDTPNNQNNDEGKPMEVDLTDDSNPGGSSIANESPVSASGSSVPCTPTSTAKLNTPSGGFKTPQPQHLKTPSTPTSSSKKRKRLTPDEKLLREKERLEKRRKLEEEKQKKEEEKLEKARQKEAERVKKEEEKRRQEEEKKREREKKEEEKKRIEEEKRLEREKKEEEKKRLEDEKKQDRLKKEEERLKKEEERKKKDEEKRQKLEEKEKELKKIEAQKEKQKQLLSSFFHKSATPKVKTVVQDEAKPKDADPKLAPEVNSCPLRFNPLPFQIKTDMAVAPTIRRKLKADEISRLNSIVGFVETSVEEGVVVDKKTPSQGDYSTSDLLKVLKQGKGRRCDRTSVDYSKDNDSDIQILDNDNEKPKSVEGYIKWRMKLLQFHDNRRPAYWGTWKRVGKKVSARRPLSQEQDLDYDFDSDDEWEDEPEDAEEIGDSDKEEKDGDDPEEAEPDDDEEGWMVPHGYLSDTEREGTGGDIESMKNKEKEFYKSLKEKTLIGLPLIETQNLACFTMRTCPVFKSADPVKPVRKRTKPTKKPPVEEIEKKGAETDKLEATNATSQRKSKRSIKAPDTSNPYARPPSGFLALQLASDDEEDDMDYADDSSSSSSESESESGEDEEMLEKEDEKKRDKENDKCSSSSGSDLEDLFIPIPNPKAKKPPST